MIEGLFLPIPVRWKVARVGDRDGPAGAKFKANAGRKAAMLLLDQHRVQFSQDFFRRSALAAQDIESTNQCGDQHGCPHALAAHIAQDDANRPVRKVGDVVEIATSAAAR